MVIFFCDPFYWHGLILTPAWISNYMARKSVGWNYLSIPKLQLLYINVQGPVLLTWFNFNPSMDK